MRVEVLKSLVERVDSHEATLRLRCQNVGRFRGQIQASVSEDVLVGDPQFAVLHAGEFRTFLALALAVQAFGDAGLSEADGHAVLWPNFSAALAFVIKPLPHVAIALALMIRVRSGESCGWVEG